jgi:hypothetical protein
MIMGSRQAEPVFYVEHVLTAVGGAWHRAYKDRTMCRRTIHHYDSALSVSALPHCIRCYPMGHPPCPR